VKGASTLSNSSALNTVLPTTRKRSTVKVLGTVSEGMGGLMGVWGSSSCGGGISRGFGSGWSKSGGEGSRGGVGSIGAGGGTELGS